MWPKCFFQMGFRVFVDGDKQLKIAVAKQKPGATAPGLVFERVERKRFELSTSAVRLQRSTN
jgi:hypothetical protein